MPRTSIVTILLSGDISEVRLLLRTLPLIRLFMRTLPLLPLFDAGFVVAGAYASMALVVVVVGPELTLLWRQRDNRVV